MSMYYATSTVTGEAPTTNQSNVDASVTALELKTLKGINTAKTIQEQLDAKEDAASAETSNLVDVSVDNAILAANELRTKMLAHAASIFATGAHVLADDASFTSVGDAATDLSTLLTLVTYELTGYAAHDTDAKSATPTYHVAQYAGSDLTSTAAPTTLAEAITRLKDLQTKFNAHDADTTAHTNGLLFQVSQAFHTYSVGAEDELILVRDTSDAWTITIPTARLESGKKLEIKDGSGAASTNNITIDTQGSEKIDGANTYVLSVNYDAVSLMSDGGNWFTSPTDLVTDAYVMSKLCAGFSSTTGAISSSSSLISAISKLDGNLAATDSVADAALPSASFTDAAVTGKVLTGYAKGSAAALAATDTILAAFGKLEGDLDGKVSTTLASTNFYVGNGSNVATAVAMSSDATMANTGAVTIASGAVTVTKCAASFVAEATGTWNDTIIGSMNSIPTSLIAAPGSGKVIVIDEVELFHDYSTAAWSGGGDVKLYYNGGSDIVLFDASIITGASDTNRIVRPTIYDLDAATGTAIGFDVTANANAAVYVTCASGDFSDGNANNKVKWRIRYHTVTLLT